MRTAVVRVDVDPAGELPAARLAAGVDALCALAHESGVEVVDNGLAVLAGGRREAELLMVGADPEQLRQSALMMCARAFGTDPVPGVITYVSRGTDEDARGVLAGFGVTGQIVRTAGDDGFDILDVTLHRCDVTRVAESRLYTALEASTNCEVRIHIV